MKMLERRTPTSPACERFIFTKVLFVCRERGGNRFSPTLEAMVSSFLDPCSSVRTAKKVIHATISMPNEYSLRLIKHVVRLHQCHFYGKVQEILVKSLQCKDRELFYFLYKVFIDERDCLLSCKTMDALAGEGQLDLIQKLYDERTNGFTIQAITKAAANGHLNVIKWLHELGYGCSTAAMDKAASNGHLEVVKWLHENRQEGCTTVAMDGAARYGHLEIIKWLHANRQEGCTSKAMDDAAALGNLEIVQWLHENRDEGCSVAAMDEAAEEGHLQIVEWLAKNRTEGCTRYAIERAAQNGHLEVVKWLYKNKQEKYSPHAIQSAAWSGHLDIVQYLEECFHRRKALTTDAVSLLRKGFKRPHWAIENEKNDEKNEEEYDVGPVKFACFYEMAQANHHESYDQEESERFQRYTVEQAANMNKLSLLKRLHKLNTEGNWQSAMDSAATEGHLEVVKWLHENRTEGCTEDAMDWAARFGHLEVVQWLHENRKEGCTTRALDNAAYFGHYDVVEWLCTNRKEGCTVEGVKEAISQGNVEIVQLLQERFKFEEDILTILVEKAVSYGHFGLVIWLIQNQNAQFSFDSLFTAASKGYLHILRWLWDHQNVMLTTMDQNNLKELQRTAESNGNRRVVNWMESNREMIQEALSSSSIS